MLEVGDKLYKRKDILIPTKYAIVTGIKTDDGGNIISATYDVYIKSGDITNIVEDVEYSIRDSKILFNFERLKREKRDNNLNELLDDNQDNI